MIQDQEPVQLPPSGIGGWLVLVAIGLVVQPFRLLRTLVEGLQTFESETWRRLTTPSSPAYHPAWRPFLVVDALATAAFLVGSFVLLYLFFRKRAAFPRTAIGFLAASALFQLGEIAAILALVGAAGVGKEIGQVMFAVVSAVAWIAYLAHSRRVAATFVN